MLSGLKMSHKDTPPPRPSWSSIVSEIFMIVSKLIFISLALRCIVVNQDSLLFCSGAKNQIATRNVASTLLSNVTV